MKAATMVLNMLDYAIVYIPSFFKACCNTNLVYALVVMKIICAGQAFTKIIRFL